MRLEVGCRRLRPDRGCDAGRSLPTASVVRLKYMTFQLGHVSMPDMPRVAASIMLSDAERTVLWQWSRGRRTPTRPRTARQDRAARRRRLAEHGHRRGLWASGRKPWDSGGGGLLSSGRLGSRRTQPGRGRPATVQRSAVEAEVIRKDDAGAADLGDALEYADAGGRAGDQPRERPAHLEAPRVEAPPGSYLQGQQQPALRGEARRHRGPLSQPAGQRPGLLGRREEPDSSPRPDSSLGCR